MTLWSFVVLNLHVHFHSLAPDGVFSDDGAETLTFHPLPPPSDDDVIAVATRTASRVLKKLTTMEDDLADDPDEAGALFDCRCLDGPPRPDRTQNRPFEDVGEDSRQFRHP